MQPFAVRSLITALIAASLLAGCAGAPTPGVRSTQPMTADEQRRFADSINTYRVARQLPRIAVSASLMAVARAHLEDLEQRYRRDTQCNMHSWSNAANWSGCCYTPDHARAACMWDKPREITRGRYSSPGYEIVAHYSDPITPARALLIWQESPPHLAMLLNMQQWAQHPWQAMGAAIGPHYAVVWFGEEPDSAAH